eukprot:scaffold277597_cov26-Tisochrysis_lutea.AAC.1
MAQWRYEGLSESEFDVEVVRVIYCYCLCLFSFLFLILALVVAFIPYSTFNPKAACFPLVPEGGRRDLPSPS